MANQWKMYLFERESSVGAIICRKNKFTNGLLLEMWPCVRVLVCPGGFVWVLSVQTGCSSSPGRIDMNILSLTGSTDG